MCLKDKFQIPNTKHQINPNHQYPKFQTAPITGFGHWKLEFRICLEFGAWDLGFPGLGV
jgi:hypothetical protein